MLNENNPRQIIFGLDFNLKNIQTIKSFGAFNLESAVRLIQYGAIS